jgi:hypothetical protein
MSDREATGLRNVAVVAAKTLSAKKTPSEPAKVADSIKLNKPKAQ